MQNYANAVLKAVCHSTPLNIKCFSQHLISLRKYMLTIYFAPRFLQWTLSEIGSEISKMAGKPSRIWKFIIEEENGLKAALFNTKSLPVIERGACVCANHRVWDCTS
jgi:hypothetical protein